MNIICKEVLISVCGKLAVSVNETECGTLLDSFQSPCARIYDLPFSKCDDEMALTQRFSISPTISFVIDRVQLAMALKILLKKSVQKHPVDAERR